MSKEIDELLKILDMSEGKQWKWITDLAFRLRNEALEYQGWTQALKLVYDYWQGQNRTGITFEGFWIHKAQPIHWIIAALIAKQLTQSESSTDGTG